MKKRWLLVPKHVLAGFRKSRYIGCLDFVDLGCRIGGASTALIHPDGRRDTHIDRPV